jgi:hypothetical protein
MLSWKSLPLFDLRIDVALFFVSLGRVIDDSNPAFATRRRTSSKDSASGAASRTT